MVAYPLTDPAVATPAGTLVTGLAGIDPASGQPAHDEVLGTGSRPQRRLSIYPASAGFDLVEELDFLSARTVEPNLFFNPRFLAPAMPRLEDREVRLAILRDGADQRSRLRLLLPFSIERPAAVPLGISIIRSWSSPFGPVGTPLVDRDDPEGVLSDFFSMLTRPGLGLPRILVVPDIRLDGPVAALMRAVADSRGLAIETTAHFKRPFLESTSDGDTYLRGTLSAHHFREFRRLKRRLETRGTVEHRVARGEEEVRDALETFLTLEASGWKGRQRTAMAVDRFRAAFAREAVHRLAERDLCRIHALTLNGEAIASLIVFVEGGVAYTWKTAYDETFSAYSPGTLLMIEVTRQHLDDPNIEATDSCAVPDHPVMSRLWSERREIGTLLIGLEPGMDRAVRQAASQLHLYRETRNLARIVRNRLRGWLGRR